METVSTLCRFLSVLILAIFTAPFNGWAQEADDENSPKPIIPMSGAFELSEAPIFINLPDGFVFLDGAATRDILVNYWGNDQSAVSNVVGMIIPDTVSKIAYIDKEWIISHRDIGHVNDSDAADIDFGCGLDVARRARNGYSNVVWAWDPKYDTINHRLSLPLMSITGTDSTLLYKQITFGKTGMIMVEPIVPLSDMQWLHENDDKINNSIGFSYGNWYEDFDSVTQPLGYNSIESFIKGRPAYSSNLPTDYAPVEDSTALEEDEDASFSDILIGIIAKVAIVLVAVMLLLMLAVSLTNKKDESGKGILQSGINVLLRIGVFAMVYLLIFTFAIFLIWAGVKIAIIILSSIFSLKLFLILGAALLLIVGFLFAIIQSLFITSHPEYPNRLEISQSDAPKLFSLIEEISKSVGEKMPKRVYVSPDVNACVFYDKPFLNIFFQGSKNLEVGLGLLFGLNHQEFKAIIAHEYGHFGQKSMRIGQIVSICYNIISNLVHSGRVFIVQSILAKTFVYVQRGYMSLSRSMEYEADSKSAMVVGNEALISALCKTEIIANRFEVYNSLLQSIYDSKKIIPTSYWNGYNEFLTMAKDFDGIMLDETITATAPLSNSHKSRVQLKNPWISHPTLEQRIESIKLSTNNIVGSANESLKNLVPTKLYDESSRILFSNAGYSRTISYSDTEYRELLEKELGEKSFTLEIRPFFNRNFCKFDVDPDKETSTADSEDVFSVNNAKLVESYNQAISDYQLMAMFVSKQVSEKQIQYEGQVYNRKNVPIVRQLDIVDGLKTRVASIDKSVCLLALSKTDDKGLIIKAYDDIFYSQDVVRHISRNILPLRGDVESQIGSGGEISEESFNRIKSILLRFKANMIELVDSLELDRLNPVMHVDAAKSIKHVEDEYLFMGGFISSADIEYILTLPEQLISLYQSLAYYSKKIISDTIEGKAPLMYWNNSVAAAMND